MTKRIILKDTTNLMRLNAMKKKYKKYDILYVIACLQSKSNSIDHLVPQYSAL